MAAVLTLHQGDQEAEYIEHPTEVARKALLAAAEIEVPRWSALLIRFAESLRHGRRS